MEKSPQKTKIKALFNKNEIMTVDLN